MTPELRTFRADIHALPNAERLPFLRAAAALLTMMDEQDRATLAASRGDHAGAYVLSRSAAALADEVTRNIEASSGGGE